MPYAEGRTFLDADSHLMELPDFLREHADPGLREQMPPLSFSSGGKLGDALQRLGRTKRHPDERVAELVGLGDGLISGPKGYEALGAFNPAERSQALDQLGFDRQFVFSTFATGAFFPPNTDPELAAGAARAHNRGMAEFCADDDRLGRGRHHPRRPGAALVELEHPPSRPGAVWVPPPGWRSPPATTTSIRSGPAWPTPASPPCSTSAGRPQLAPADEHGAAATHRLARRRRGVRVRLRSPSTRGRDVRRHHVPTARWSATGPRWAIESPVGCRPCPRLTDATRRA
jgi:hypothetical protein